MPRRAAAAGLRLRLQRACPGSGPHGARRPIGRPRPSCRLTMRGSSERSILSA